ncbi:hypothetical protein JKP88DRAFT_232049 [Tribonema minus]|uniref:Uncharacterized protein n=1 Tax=Tribonema minus TaxID=303371 RepID=A0A835ZBJ7_9STRA|nr:hypothetical protein JKP88DRAFT_232049 [Tribonema minus]
MKAIFAAAAAAMLCLAADAFLLPAQSNLHSHKTCITSARAAKPDSEDSTESKAVTQSVNARLLEEINSSMPKYRVLEGATRLSVEREEVDLNGVQPLMAFLGSVGAGAMSAGAWRLTNVLAGIYLVQSEKFANSDILAVQRLTGLMKQVIVGLGTLATGVFGVTALGMALLGGRVLMGVVSGELDPSKVDEKASSSRGRGPAPTAQEGELEDVKQLLAKADAEIAAQLQQARRQKQAQPDSAAVDGVEQQQL